MEKESKPSGDLGNMLFLFSLVAVFTMFLFLHLWRNIQFANIEYEIRSLKKEMTTLFIDVEKFRQSAADYSAITRVDKLYQEKFGHLPLEKGKKIITLELPEISFNEE